MSATSTSSDRGSRPIVDLPPPSPAVRDSVARLIITLLARQALVELGVIASNENAHPQ